MNETVEGRIERQGRFAEYVLGQQEWPELLNDVNGAVVQEWMRATTVEAREQAHAKVKALGVVHGLLKTWQDKKLVQDQQADQAPSTPAP